MALVLDTGVIYAALDENDADHERCAALIATTEETLVVRRARSASTFVTLEYPRHLEHGVQLRFAALH